MKRYSRFSFLFSFLFVFLFAYCLTAAQTTVTVSAANANLRGTPNQQGKIVTVVPQGATVKILISKVPWYLVQTADYAGWLHGNTIRLIATDESDDADFTEPTPIYSPPPATGRSPSRTSPPSPPRSSSRFYIRGPRGGCYYINSNGRKNLC